jgi:hypothetical protein
VVEVASPLGAVVRHCLSLAWHFDWGVFMMDRREAEALDRHITGNYGEDQFKQDADGLDEDKYLVDSYDDEWFIAKCQIANCDEDSEDGVLCPEHQQPLEEDRNADQPS